MLTDVREVSHKRNILMITRMLQKYSFDEAVYNIINENQVKLKLTPSDEQGNAEHPIIIDVLFFFDKILSIIIETITSIISVITTYTKNHFSEFHYRSSD